MLQEKDKLRKSAETEIERLKEELRQQKDREDRNRRQINGRLKQKTEDFEHLHREYKRLETEHRERMDELRQEVDRAATAFADERAESANGSKPDPGHHAGLVKPDEKLD